MLQRVPKPLGGMEDASRLSIITAGSSEIKGNYVIGSSHNAVRIWNLNESEYDEHIAERNVNAKIVSMCAHTNLNSSTISSDDIYIVYAGDIVQDIKTKARSNALDSADMRKTHSKGKKRRSSNISNRKLNSGSKYLITIWKWNCVTRKRYVHSSVDCVSFGAHSGTIGSLIIIDGKTSHNRDSIIQENPILVSGSEDRTVKIWNLYSREPIYFVSTPGNHMLGDISHVSNTINVSSNVPALHAYYPDKSDVEILSTKATSASSTEMMDVPHLFIGTEDGSILCYNFFIAEHFDEYNEDNPFEKVDVQLDAPSNVLRFSVSLGRRFRLQGHTDGVNDFALLKQKNYQLESMKEVDTFLISCAEDKTVMMWDVLRNGTLLRTFTGHTGVVQSLCVCHAWENADSENLIISGSWDHSIAIWNPRDGSLLKTFKTAGTVVTLAAFSEEIQAKKNFETIIKKRSYMLYNDSSCGIAMSPIKVTESSLKYSGRLYAEGKKCYSIIKSCALPHPLNLLAIVVTRKEHGCEGDHVLKIFDTCDATARLIQCKYTTRTVDGTNEYLQMSKNNSIVLSTALERSNGLGLDDALDDCETPCLLKYYSIPCEIEEMVVMKDIIVYACGKIVNIYTIEPPADLTNGFDLYLNVDEPVTLDSETLDASLGIDSDNTKSSTTLAKQQFDVTYQCHFELKTSVSGSVTNLHFEDSIDSYNHIVDMSVCCTGNIFAKEPIIILALQDSLLIYKLNTYSMCFTASDALPLRGSGVFSDNFIATQGDIQCMAVYEQDVVKPHATNNRKILHICCGHEGGGISILHCSDSRVVDESTMGSSTPRTPKIRTTTASFSTCGLGDTLGSKSMALNVDGSESAEDVCPVNDFPEEFHLHVSKCVVLRGHQHTISCLAHMPIYKNGRMIQNCLVSGSKDSTFRVWDLCGSNKELAFGRALETGVTSVTISTQNVDGVPRTHIVTTSDDFLIYVWVYNPSNCTVALNRRLINHSSLITGVNLISCWSVDDHNRTYKDEVEMDLESVAEVFDRPLYVLSHADKLVNIWDISMSKHTIPNYAELETALEYDLGQAVDYSEENIAADDAAMDESQRILNRELSKRNSNIMAINDEYMCEIRTGDAKGVELLATELLVRDENVAARIFAWNGGRLFSRALDDDSNGLWNLVVLALPKCPHVLLRNELRFMYTGVSKSGFAVYRSLLSYALSRNKLVHVRIIIDCWIKILNVPIKCAYDQFYLPSLYMPLQDILELASKSPVEFEHFMTSLNVLRSHNIVHGVESTFPLRKYMISGVSAAFDSDSFWKARFAHLSKLSEKIFRKRDWRVASFEQYLSTTVAGSWLEWIVSEVLYVFFVVYTFVLNKFLLDNDAKEAVRAVSTSGKNHAKLVTGYYSPLVHCANEKLLVACVEACRKLGRTKVFDSDLVSIALKYAWKRYGRMNHRIQMYKFVAYCSFFAYSCFGFGIYQKPDNNHLDKFLFVLLGYIPQIGLILSTLYFILEERHQMKYSNTGVFKHFTDDIWNGADAIAYLMILFGASSRLIMFVDTDFSRACMAAASICMIVKFVYFFRAFESTGHLVAYMVQIIKGIGYFLCILTLIVCGFAGAFWILSVKQTERNSAGTVDGAIFVTFEYMIGGGDPASDMQTVGNHHLYRILYITFMIVTGIVLLNLLIAIMNDIYSDVDKVAQERFRWEQAAVILDNMHLLSDEDRQRYQCDPLVIHYITIRNPLEKEDGSNLAANEHDDTNIDDLAESLRELHVKNERLSNGCRAHQIDIEKKLNNINEVLSVLAKEIRNRSADDDIGSPF